MNRAASVVFPTPPLPLMAIFIGLLLKLAKITLGYSRKYVLPAIMQEGAAAVFFALFARPAAPAVIRRPVVAPASCLCYGLIKKV